MGFLNNFIEEKIIYYMWGLGHSSEEDTFGLCDIIRKKKKR